MEKPLNIPNVLLLNKNFDVGGTESHVRDLANGLSDKGANVFVASQTGRQNELLYNSIPFISLYLRPHVIFSNLLQTISIIRNNNIQIIHAHSRRAITFGALVSIILRIPLVVTVHGRVKYDLRSRFARLQAKRVILVNKNIYQEISDWYILGKKSTFISNGCTLTEHPSKLSNEKISFVYVSRIDRKHFSALKVLIEVFKSDPFNKISLLKIVGDGGLSQQLQSYIKSCDSDNIRYVGYQSDPSEFLKRNHVVIGVGRVAIEGLCAGKSVYTLNGAHRGQLVTSNNFDELKSSNFVNINGEKASNMTVSRDITDIIQNFHTYKLPRRIEVDKIESLSINISIDSTIDVYQSVISNKLLKKERQKRAPF